MYFSLRPFLSYASKGIVHPKIIHPHVAPKLYEKKKKIFVNTMKVSLSLKKSSLCSTEESKSYSFGRTRGWL